MQCVRIDYVVDDVENMDKYSHLINLLKQLRICLIETYYSLPTFETVNQKKKVMLRCTDLNKLVQRY